MKKFFVASALLASISGTAFAADLPSRVAPPVYAPPVPMFTWTGAYFGINAGYAFDHEGKFTNFGNTAVNTGVISGNRPGSVSRSSDGFTGGGQVGYNFQVPGFGGFGGPGSGIVFGMEADAAYTDLSKSGTYVGNAGGISNFRSGLDFLGTFRGRVGYAFGQFLVYGTGGFAYGGVKDNVTFANAAGVTNYSGVHNKIETGYTYGGGVEYALPTSSFLNFFKSSAVTIKAEYLHYDLGRTNVLLAAAPGSRGSYTSRVSNDGDLARIGLNYKFGSY
ncbi:porin family protein [Hyphomicrobiales bacterium BP6-180914]|uniref:Porin family protein n=1 Tax=Lichenifustis flavocetrariae TaxID=2949735 RepID=A0AA41YS27_9HYPH|nr:porin family protein [Lichenifustis flavocetrariae]MCW6507529.1 porin family protein [Lichenifustis flavocetrariae]